MPPGLGKTAELSQKVALTFAPCRSMTCSDASPFVDWFVDWALWPTMYLTHKLLRTLTTPGLYGDGFNLYLKVSGPTQRSWYSAT